MYNGITVYDPPDDILNLSIVYLLWCRETVVVVLPHKCFQAFLVLLCARFPCCFGLCVRDVVLSQMTEVSLAHVAQCVTDTQSLLLLMHPDHEGTPRFKSHLVVWTRLRCLPLSFFTRVVHGSGAFVLTCGCGWSTVPLVRATGETIVTGSVVEESGNSRRDSTVERTGSVASCAT